MLWFWTKKKKPPQTPLKRTYIVITKEVYEIKLEIQANSEREASQKIHRGMGNKLSERLEKVVTKELIEVSS